VTPFTNWMEPHARSRDIFSFHRPETLLAMAQEEKPLRAWLTITSSPHEDGVAQPFQGRIR